MPHAARMISVVLKAPALSPTFGSNAQVSENETFSDRVNMHRTHALAQCVKRPIQGISASLILSLKIRKIQLVLSDFDPECVQSYTPTLSLKESWLALRRLRGSCISVFSKWI